MALPTIMFEGRVNKSELRYTPGGDPVLNLDIACNSRKFNKDTNQWEDGDVYWINGASLWGRKAEAANESIGVGSIVTGSARLRTRSYEKDGQRRSATDHMIESVGVVAVPSRDGGGQPAPASGGFGQSQGFAQPAQGGGWGSQDDSVPF